MKATDVSHYVNLVKRQEKLLFMLERYKQRNAVYLIKRVSHLIRLVDSKVLDILCSYMILNK